MQANDLGVMVSEAVIGALQTIVNFLPSLIGGLIVLIIGLIIAAIVQRIVVAVLKLIKLEDFLKRYGIYKIEGKEIAWSEILAELARWFVIIVFLIPTVQTWGLGATTQILDRILLFIPNVAVAVVIGLVGIVFANLASRIVFSAANALGRPTAHTLSMIARWSILIFVGLTILSQLGIAQDIIRILVTGVIGMAALAGGLAFGFGGQDVAKDILESLRKKLQK